MLCELTGRVEFNRTSIIECKCSSLTGYQIVAHRLGLLAVARGTGVDRF